MKAPFVLVAVAGLVGVANAQVGLPKNQTSNFMGDSKVLKSQQVYTGGVFSGRADAADNCGDAPVVGNGDVVNYDLGTASNDSGASCGSSGSAPDMWAKVTATGDTRYVITTCGLSGGDTVLAAFDGCGGGEIICNDDNCGLQSRIAFNLMSGQSAWIRVAGYNGNVHAGAFSVTASPVLPAVPATDNCADAPAGVNGGLYDFDLTTATNDFAASCGASSAAADMWVKYTAGATSEQVTATTCDLAGSDTTLAMVDGCGGAELACNDDACGLQSTVATIIGAGQTVYIRIAGYNGGTFAGQLSLSTIQVTPPANDSCETAEAITVGGATSFDSTFADDDGAASCGFNGNPGGHSVYFKFTSDRNGAVEAFTCDTTAFDTIISMTEGCGGAEVACNDDTCGLQSYFLANVTAGTEYVIRVSGYAAAAGVGSITVNYAEPCVISQPSGSTVEAEDCGGDVNGGCNAGDGAVTAASVDSTYYGTAWADANFRDTDWYEFTLDEARDLTLTGKAAFPLRLFILDNLCDPTIIATAASTRPCQEVTVTASLAAGTYRAFAGVDGFAGYPCGGGTDNHYILTIGNAGADCLADFNNDDFVDFFDYADYVLCFEEGTCPPGRTADTNGDDFVDFFDYADYVVAFETGC